MALINIFIVSDYDWLGGRPHDLLMEMPLFSSILGEELLAQKPPRPDDEWEGGTLCLRPTGRMELHDPGLSTVQWVNTFNGYAFDIWAGERLSIKLPYGNFSLISQVKKLPFVVNFSTLH